MMRREAVAVLGLLMMVPTLGLASPEVLEGSPGESDGPSVVTAASTLGDDPCVAPSAMEPAGQVLATLQDLGVTPGDPDIWVLEAGDCMLGDLRFLDAADAEVARIEAGTGDSMFRDISGRDGSLASLVVSGALSAGSASVAGLLTAGSASVSGHLDAGSATIQGGFQAGSANVLGTLIAGSASITGSLDAASATVSGDATVGGNIQVGGEGAFGGGLSASSASITGALSAASASTAGNLQVGGAANVAGSLDASSVSVRHLAVAERANISGDLRAGGSASIEGALTASSASVTGTLITGGSVGIGTASPGAKLEVYGQGATGGGTLMLNSNANDGNLYFGPSTRIYGYSPGRMDFYTNGAHRLSIESNGRVGIGVNGGPGAQLHVEGTAGVILNAGNVGIGTSSPQAQLHISKDSALPSFRLERTGTGARAWEWTVGSSPAGRLSLSDVSAVAERLTIDTSGNVGIGTTSPAAKLDVAGNMDFDGQKACATHLNGIWSTTLVPSGWSRSTCSGFAQSNGGSNVRLVCIFENSFSLGAASQGPFVVLPAPSQNCGW